MSKTVTRFNIPAMTDEDKKIADTPEIGAESQVYYSLERAEEVADITQSAPNSGSLEVDAGAIIPAAGAHMQLVAGIGIRSAAQVIVTFGVTLADNTTTTAVATFGVPAYVRDQTYNLPQGLAVDIIPQGSGNSEKKIKTINSLTSIAGGDNGNKFKVIYLPNSFEFIACAESKEATLPISKSLPIPCGFNASAYTKRGRGDAGTLSLGAKHFNFADGISRLCGHSGVTIMIEVLKDDRILSERQVFTGYIPVPQSPRGGGDDEVMDKSEGNFENFAVFV